MTTQCQSNAPRLESRSSQCAKRRGQMNTRWGLLHSELHLGRFCENLPNVNGPGGVEGALTLVQGCWWFLLRELRHFSSLKHTLLKALHKQTNFCQFQSLYKRHVAVFIDAASRLFVATVSLGIVCSKLRCRRKVRFQFFGHPFICEGQQASNKNSSRHTFWNHVLPSLMLAYVHFACNMYRHQKHTLTIVPKCFTTVFIF